MAVMVTGFGPRTMSVELLFAGMQELSGSQMDRVAAAWHTAPPQARASAWTAVRRHLIDVEREGAWDAAVEARRMARRCAREAGLHDWAFAYAAWDAAMAVAARDLLDDGSYRRLVAPMGVALHWLTESAGVRSQGIAAAPR